MPRRTTGKNGTSAKPRSADRGTLLVPFVPLRDVVVFPQMVIPVFIGRQSSVQAVERAMRGDRKLFVAAQTDPRADEPTLKQLYHYGARAELLQVLKLPDGSLKVLIEGNSRARLLRLQVQQGAALATVLPEEFAVSPNVTVRALLRTVLDQFGDYVKLNRRIPPEVVVAVTNLDDIGLAADIVCANLVLKVADKQALLEQVDPVARLRMLSAKLHSEIEILTLEKQIRQQVSRQIEDSQKEYYLNEQLKAIQKELGRQAEGNEEIRELEEKIDKGALPEDVAARARKELKRLEKLQPLSAEAGVVRTYLDWLVELPWTVKALPPIDLAGAEQLLDSEHYGLEDAKKRIVEYLAVHALVEKVRGQILCFVGPPGVGKTSVARSIAHAMGREFVRLSLGGVRDEAEIRGHRRTYVGALPGRIIQSLHKVKSRNCVFLLDEIDKMSTDFRGDPSAALLEVLDPEQNAAFSDHYLEIPYDLSEVFFITTANTMYDIPLPLRDRMEIIRFAGYSEHEKLAIAQQFIIPRQVPAHGLPATVFTDDAVREVIRRYTREAGVRNLERELASVCRKRATETVKARQAAVPVRGKKTVVAEPAGTITPTVIRELLGVPRYRNSQAEEKPAVGVACGLAWTELGGEILNVEAAILPGKGHVQLTGKLGDVMKESAQAAITYARAQAKALKVPADFHRTRDIHIHVPEGAIPKDGPSAGVTMATALVSALTRRPVRHDLAMTGEITLHGKVLPVGGIKEKVLAAQRAGISEVILPQENEKDFNELPERERGKLTAHYVSRIDEVLRLALKK